MPNHIPDLNHGDAMDTNINDTHALALQITSHLFTSGCGNIASRLALMSDEINIGGWSQHAVRYAIEKILNDAMRTSDAMLNGDPMGRDIGLTKRDWFAGMALCGMLADQTISQTWSERAEEAYDLADAMLKERDA